MTAFLILFGLVILAFIIPSNLDPAIRLKEYVMRKQKDQSDD